MDAKVKSAMEERYLGLEVMPPFGASLQAGNRIRSGSVNDQKQLREVLEKSVERKREYGQRASATDHIASDALRAHVFVGEPLTFAPPGRAQRSASWLANSTYSWV